MTTNSDPITPCVLVEYPYISFWPYTSLPYFGPQLSHLQTLGVSACDADNRFE